MKSAFHPHRNLQLLNAEVLLHSLYHNREGGIGLAQFNESSNPLHRILRRGNNGRAGPHIAQTLGNPIVHTTHSSVTRCVRRIHGNVVLNASTPLQLEAERYCITIRGTR